MSSGTLADLSLDDLRPFIYANHDAISTVIIAMMHRTSRVRAVEFLKSLVEYGEILIHTPYSSRQLNMCYRRSHSKG